MNNNDKKQFIIAKSNANKFLFDLKEWQYVHLFKLPEFCSHFSFKVDISDQYALSISFYPNIETTLIDVETGKLTSNKQLAYDNSNGGIRFFNSNDQLKEELLRLYKIINDKNLIDTI